MCPFKYLRWFLVLFWCLVIFLLSHQPGLATSLSYDFILRKIAHVVEFMVLFALTYWALRKHKLSVKRCVWIALSFSILYAISDEIHQSFVPDRSGSVLDVVYDSIGVLFLFSLYRLKKPSIVSV